MDDKYLDNVFREKLELPQQHDFDESAWLDLENRLENKSRRRIVPWRWLAAAGILLPMLMMSFYFYYELRQTERQLARLETKMNNLLQQSESKGGQDVSNKAALATNNLVENAVMLRKSATKPKSEESALSSNESLFPKGNSSEVNSLTMNENRQKWSIQTPTVTMEDDNLIIKEEEAIAEVANLSFSKKESDQIAVNSTFLESKNKVAANGFKQRQTVPELNYFNMIQNENKLKMKESVWTQATEYFIPVGFEVSIGSFAGTQVPTTTPIATIQNEKPFFNNQGVELAANFINGVDLIVGANFANYSYLTTTISQDFPSVAPNAVGDIFNNVMVTEDVVQVPVALKYNFGEYDDVFAPFIEIGGIAKRSVKKHHRFEYLPTSRGDEPYAIRPKPQRIRDDFAMNTASVAGGIKWNPKVKNQVLDNVVIQAETFVNADFETPETVWSVGVGVSANYMF